MDAADSERIKLTATMINNLAAAFAVTGFIAPVATGQIDHAGLFVVALVWLGIAAGLHYLARAILKGLT